MPIVPRADQGLVPQGATPGVRVPTEIPGAAFGVAAPPVDLSGVQRSLKTIADDATQKANQVAFVDADAKMSALETSLLYDPQTGALNQRGKNAFGVGPAVSEAWTKGVDAISTGLSDQQLQHVHQSAAVRWSTMNQTLQHHIAGETRAHDQESTQALVSNEHDAAVANFQDPQRITLAVARQIAAIRDLGRRNGLPDEQVTHLVETAVSGTHVAVIDRLLATEQDLAAKAYYDQHKEDIVGSQAVAVDKALQEGSSRGESQRQADAIARAGGTLTEQVQKARAIENPRVRDLTEARLRQNDAETKSAAREQAEQNMVTAGNLVDQSGSVTRIPPAMWAQFTPAQKSSLESYAAIKGSGGQVKTDWSEWVSLRDMASNPATRDAFLALDPMSYRTRLADPEFREITALREGLRKGDGRALQTADDVSKLHGVIAGTLKGIGIGVNPKHREPDAVVSETVYRTVATEVEALQARTKTKATTKQVQDITDEVVTQHLVARHPSFFDFNQSPTEMKRTFELTPQDDLVVTAQDLTPANRAAIAASLHARGLPATESTILGAYKAHLLHLVRRGPQ